MAGGQIVAQAPFIAASGAAMPIAAPILLFQAMTTVMIMNEFRLVHDKLNELHRGVNRVLQRSEASHIAAIISASAKIEEIEGQLLSCKEFTPSMVLRLCVLEDKVSSIVERYRFLYEQEYIDSAAKGDQLRFKDSDAYLAVIAAILDLRIDLLRLKLALQESPAYMTQAQSNFLTKCEAYNRLFEDIDRFRLKTDLMPIQLGEAIGAMNWWERNVPNCLWGDRDRSRKLEEQKEEFESHVKAGGRSRQDVTRAREITGKLVRQVIEPMHLVYWRDELGEHSYYTSDIELKPASS